jgi:hypothetical protein
VIKRMLCVLMMTIDIIVNVIKQQKKIITKCARIFVDFQKVLWNVTKNMRLVLVTKLDLVVSVSQV